MSIDTKYNLKEVVRAVLFVAGEGVEKHYLAEKLDVSMKELEKADKIDDLDKTVAEELQKIIVVRLNAEKKF